MADSTNLRMVLLRPSEFENFEAAVGLAGTREVDLAPRLADLLVVAIIVDAQGQPLWQPTLFLTDCAIRGRGVTGDTVRSYGEALLVWLRFLAARGEEPGVATEETLGIYRARLSRMLVAKHDRGYSPATINHRISICAQFYLWGQQTGEMPTPLGLWLAQCVGQRGRGRRNWRLRGSGRALTLTPIRRLPSVLSPEQLTQLFAVAPMPYRLIFKWALTTGLRRFEICNLTRNDLASAEAVSFEEDSLLKIVLVRKGGRAVPVYMPAKLLDETNWYMLTERPKPAPGSEAFVFLSRRGTSISRDRASTVFRRCADHIGSHATLHHLRHTYAVNLFSALQSCEDENTLKTVQVLMGHASVETTEIYLDALEVASPAVMAALNFLYGAVP